MKSNNLSTWLFNPFIRIAGWKAFGIGIIIVCITVIIGHFSNTIYFGVLEVKAVSGFSLEKAFLSQAIGLFGTILFMYLACLKYSKDVRFQDILGTVTLSRYPFIFSSLAGFLTDPELGKEILKSVLDGTFNPVDYIGLFAVGFLMIVIIVWHVILLYNAFKVSSNIKGTLSVVLFIAVIILSEIFSFVLVYFIR